MPAGLHAGQESLGLELLKVLVEQLRATMEISDGPGASFIIRFPPFDDGHN